MTFSRALFPLAVAMLAGTMGCNSLDGADDVDTDEDNPDPNNQPVIVEGDAPPTPIINCAYPVNGNGVGVGNIVPSFHKWQGVGPGESTVREVTVAEFFDCTGALAINGHPVNAVMIDTSKFF